MPVAESRVRQAQSKSSSARGVRPRQSARARDAAVTEAELPLERFFPGCFEILLPTIMTVIPQIVDAMRQENQSRDAANRLSDEALDRSLAELLSLIGPVLSEILPVVIEQIQGEGEQRAAAGEDVFDDEALERFLPALLGASGVTR